MSLKTPERARAARLRRKARDPEKYFATRKEQKRRARDRKRGGPPKPKSPYDKSGWTPAMKEATSAEQGHRCAICREPKKRLCGDHRHSKPPEPRGMLCNGCNSLLGFAKESPEICRAAAEYLEAWAV
jgi:Recombination endonuclease VII